MKDGGCEAKQLDEEGSKRGMILSLLFDHASRTAPGSLRLPRR
jgi:hypothetical protein